jgi:Flp pilus assembly protein TadD
VWFNLGNLRLAAGDLGEAERLFGAAVARAPHDAAVRLNLGITLQRQGRFTEAEEHYQAAIRLDPQQREAYRGLAGLLLRRGDVTGAHRLLRQADQVGRRAR